MSVSSAVRIGGRSPSNATSTTAPITCATRPVRLLTGAAAFGVSAAADLGAAFLRGLVSAAVAGGVFLSSWTGRLLFALLLTCGIVAVTVGSRAPANREIGLKRMESAGAVVTSAEMAIYELLGRSDVAAFKAMLPHLR